MPVAQFGRPVPVPAQAVPSANDDAEASPELWAQLQPDGKSDRVAVAVEWPKERRLAGACAPNLVVWVRKEVSIPLTAMHMCRTKLTPDLVQ